MGESGRCNADCQAAPAGVNYNDFVRALLAGDVNAIKAFDPDRERTLEETVARALAQIEKKSYAAELEAKGYEAGRIRRYGFAFRGGRKY